MAPPKTPSLTVDAVVIDRGGRVLLIRRKHPPFVGCYALPGGFVDIGETVEAACRRELREETGAEVGRVHLVGVYSDPSRDPRGHTCAVAYLAKARGRKVQAGDDAAAAEWVKTWRRQQLAFDHKKIIADAFRLAARLERKPAAMTTAKTAAARDAFVRPWRERRPRPARSPPKRSRSY